ncbi:type II secretion system protein [Desulfamplus magnetovallimortis]|uniref:type II secretion system protein n=1 Tax=Desulfamplus magnetovallimortis TaxID=1246637 RepID=UPI001C95FD20|nr:type II secretion system protein [Desulfamplus magnetovallimortis]
MAAFFPSLGRWQQSFAGKCGRDGAEYCKSSHNGVVPEPPVHVAAISSSGASFKGVTLIELVVTMAIISILASGILPLSQMAHKRSREIELRHALRTIRTALDEYKSLADEKKISVSADSSGYPETLEILVEGVPIAGSTYKKKFLRRIPGDPMTKDGTWGLRSYADEQDSSTWGGQDVYDVYSKSDKTALDGTLYREW